MTTTVTTALGGERFVITAEGIDVPPVVTSSKPFAEALAARYGAYAFERVYVDGTYRTRILDETGLPLPGAALADTLDEAYAFAWGWCYEDTLGDFGEEA